jgi:hypothetical protein
VDVSGAPDVGYDFFIAHASADRAVAERLFDLLVGDSSVFLSSKSLRPGDFWDEALVAAQRRSLITVVLISDSTEHAFYQREEIAETIDLARADPDHRKVVPVYLTTSSQDPPYGLRRVQALRVSEQPIEEIAARLIDLCRELRPEPAPVDPEATAERSVQMWTQSEAMRASLLANLSIMSEEMLRAVDRHSHEDPLVEREDDDGGGGRTGAR